MKRSILTLSVMSFFFSLGLNADPLEVGADAPKMSVTVETGDKLELGDIYAEGATLVYFYPKSFTGGCTAQACNLRDAFADLSEAGLSVIAVSADDVETQARFRAEHMLPFHVVADTEGKLAEAFGVPLRGMGIVKIPARQTFLIVDGKVVWRDLKATPKTQAEDALAALKAAKESSEA